MSTDKQPLSRAEIMDKMMLATAILIAILAVLYAVSAIEYLVGETLAAYLGMLETGLAVLVLVIALFTVPLLVKKLSLNRQHPSGQPESFFNDIARQSFATSWAVTFLAMVVMDSVTEDFIAGMPVMFTLDLIRAILLGTFGISFFVLNQADSAGAAEQGVCE